MRWIIRIALGLVVVVAIAAAGGWAWIRTSVPEADERAAVTGLSAPVEVLRDGYGVPHIFASNDPDAAFALGFVHAQDRLAQMEAMRRLGAGRIAEVIGEAGVPMDRFMRTLGLYRLAEAQFAILPTELQGILEAYAAGVNAWLDGPRGALPPEFAATGIEPSRWTPADSLVWGRLMALRLSSNRAGELTRARLAGVLSPEQIIDLWPLAPADGPATLPGPDAAAATEIPATILSAVLEGDPSAHEDGGASNVWVVAGERSETGKPFLANDPHLPLEMPGTWYLARLVTPARQLAGATAPGLPLIVLGHNGKMAWGFTTTGGDTEDYFIELADPADPERYLTPGGAAPVETREETVRVRGAEDVKLTIRTTRHGPVVSDALSQGRLPDLGSADRMLALSAMYLRDDDRTAEALFGFNRAETPEAFRDALTIFHAPQQNIAWAHVDGAVGFMTAGRVPIRAGGDGRIPVPGWTGEYDWQGLVPIEDLPQAVDPSSGWIANANNRPGPDVGPAPLFGDWDPGYRAQRIADLIEEHPLHTLETMSAIQTDSVSLMARHLLPLMLDRLPDSAADRNVVADLRAWDGTMARDRSEPLIFAAWLDAFHRAVYADELGAHAARLGSDRPRFLAGVIESESDWCDDVTTADRETCSELLASSLDDALRRLTEQYGEDVTAWRWGEAHPALFRHPLAGQLPLAGEILNQAVAADGGSHTLYRAAYRGGDGEQPFAAVHGAGYRAVYDLADLSRSRFVIAAGQSGNPLSPFYGNMVELWRDGGSLTLGEDRSSLRETAPMRLILTPAESEP